MKKLFLAIAFLLIASIAQAACVSTGGATWLTTPDRASVYTCVSGANLGDTINVSSGTETWDSKITITKGLNIIGAGIGVTTITKGTTQNGIFEFLPSSYTSANTPLEISGFSFNFGTWVDTENDAAIIWLGPRGKSAPYVAQTNVRIHHNRFYSSGTTGVRAHAMIYRGAIYGVFDHNTTDNFTYIFRNIDTVFNNTFHANSATDGFDWNLGDQYKMYFEDNTFNFGATGYTTNCVSNSQNSGRYAFRYNRMNIAISPQPLFDVHGYSYSQMYSPFGAEIYGNYINAGSFGGKLFQSRGGSSVSFGNNVVTSSNLDFDVGTSSTYCPPDYVEEQMVHDTYYWQNRKNTTGSLAGASSGTPPLVDCGRSGNRPLEGTDYFDDVTNSGVRSGTFANLPATCSVGQGYWATNQSTTSLANMTGVSPSSPLAGTLYKCTSTNTWTSFFTPYTYPHPLTGGAVVDDIAPNVNWISPVSGSTISCTDASGTMVLTEQVNTNEASIVKVATAAEYAAGDDTYDELNTTFTTTGGFTHTRSVSRACGAAYTVYVAGADTAGNKSAVTGYTYTIGAASPDPIEFIAGTKFGENSSASVQGVTTDAYLTAYTPDSALDPTSYGYVRTETAAAVRAIALKFDLSSIPTNATVTAAVLYLYQVAGAGDATLDVSAHKVTGTAWTNASTWNSYDWSSFIAAAEVEESITLANAWNSWAIPIMVADWVATPANNKGLILTTDQGAAHATTETNRAYGLTARTDATQRPMLIVAYTVPDPADPGVSQTQFNFSGGTLTVTPSGGTLTFSW